MYDAPPRLDAATGSLTGEALATTLEPYEGARPESAEPASVGGKPIWVELRLDDLQG